MKTVYIKFFAPVDTNSSNLLVSLLDQKVKEGYERVVLLISTPGGSVFHGLSIHNYLIGIPVMVDTHNFGSVDSIGVVIFAAGNRRYSSMDARFLIHPVSLNVNGQVEIDKLEEFVKGLKIDADNIAAAIARATGKSEAVLLEAIRSRTTLSPEEAVAFGLVHEIREELFPKDAEVISITA